MIILLISYTVLQYYSVVVFDNNNYYTDVHFWQDGDTPLHKASHNGNIDVVTLLLERGANIDKVDNVSYITLHECHFAQPIVQKLSLSFLAVIDKSSTVV